MEEIVKQLGNDFATLFLMSLYFHGFGLGSLFWWLVLKDN